MLKEANLSNSSESIDNEVLELSIANEILKLIKECETTDVSYKRTLELIRVEVQKLIDIHKEQV